LMSGSELCIDAARPQQAPTAQRLEEAHHAGYRQRHSKPRRKGEGEASGSEQPQAREAAKEPAFAANVRRKEASHDRDCVVGLRGSSRIKPGNRAVKAVSSLAFRAADDLILNWSLNCAAA